MNFEIEQTWKKMDEAINMIIIKQGLEHQGKLSEFLTKENIQFLSEKLKEKSEWITKIDE